MKEKLLTLVLSAAMVISMMPTTQADEITPQEFLDGAAQVVSKADSIELVEGTFKQGPMLFGSDSQNGYWKSTYFNKTGIEYNLPNNVPYATPDEAKISLKTKAEINTGDLCVVAFKSVSANPDFTNGGRQTYQFALDNGTNKMVTTQMTSQNGFILGNWDKVNPENVWNTTYVIVTAENDFAVNSNFDTYLGFNNGQHGWIIDLQVVNVGNSYTKREVRTMLGFGSSEATVQNVLASGDVLIDNSKFINNSSYTVGNGNTIERNTFYDQTGIQFNMSTYNGYNSPADAKISTPISSAIDQGDICIVSFNSAPFWAPDNTLSLQFALKNGNNTSVSDVVAAPKNVDLSNGVNAVFSRKYYAIIVADKNYAAGSTFDVNLGFTNWQSGIICNLDMVNVHSDYQLTEIQSLFTNN